jgi:hypothetical protein
MPATGEIRPLFHNLIWRRASASPKRRPLASLKRVLEVENVRLAPRLRPAAEGVSRRLAHPISRRHA